MVLSYRNPRSSLQQLRSDVDRLVSGFLGSLPEVPWPGAGRSQPAVNIWEEPDALMAELEVPGVKPEEVEISVVGGELSLKIDRPEVQEQGVTYHRRERPVGTFTRVLRLPTDVDADRVEAELRDGVLTVRLPKAESAKPRKIKVASAT
jgi:HSP20 family protein